MESESNSGGYSYTYNSAKKDLLVADEPNMISPLPSYDRRTRVNNVIITDRVYEFNFLKDIVNKLFKDKTSRIKTDDEIINYCLLSLILDFGLY